MLSSRPITTIFLTPELSIAQRCAVVHSAPEQNDLNRPRLLFVCLFFGEQELLEAAGMDKNDVTRMIVENSARAKAAGPDSDGNVR